MSTPACLPIRTPAQPLLAIEGLSVQLHDAVQHKRHQHTRARFKPDPARRRNTRAHWRIRQRQNAGHACRYGAAPSCCHCAWRRFRGQQLLGASEQQLCALRGNSISMVFQEPMTALNPLQRVGDQVAEPLRLHQGLSKASARAQAIALLEQVGIADATQRWRDYPHQFSGGQRQRIAIARTGVQTRFTHCRRTHHRA